MPVLRGFHFVSNHIFGLITFISLASIAGLSYAQQEPQFTQYVDNMMYYNPAYAGTRQGINISGAHRQQWVGFKGGPMSSSLFIHSPLRYKSIGLGFSVLNDRTGPLNSTSLNGNFSYSFKFDHRDDKKLSLGLKAGVGIINADFNSLHHFDIGDELIEVVVQNAVVPNLGVGVYYHEEQWFIGASIPRFMEKQLFSQQKLNLQRHFYLIFGGYFNAPRRFKVRPVIKYKMTRNAPFALESSLTFIFYKQRLWLGINYRLKESLGALFQVQGANQFKIGVAAEYAVTKLVNYNIGSYELIMTYNFSNKEKTSSSCYYF